MTVRVLVVDDHELVRAGLAGIVETAPDLTVVGQAANGFEAVQLVRSEQPDVVLMDVRMPEMDGLEATRAITASSSTRVLILTTFDLDEYVYRALTNGASGFLLKDTPPPELLAAIRIVASGDALLAPSVTRRLIHDFAAQASENRPPFAAQRVVAGITDREREVLVLVGAGLSNGEIAQRLHIGPGTVKTHMSHLLRKLAARDRVQLVILAYEAGLVGYQLLPERAPDA